MWYQTVELWSIGFLRSEPSSGIGSTFLLSRRMKVSCHLSSCRFVSFGWLAFHVRHTHLPNVSRCASTRGFFAWSVPHPAIKFSKSFAHRSVRRSQTWQVGWRQSGGSVWSKWRPARYRSAGTTSIFEPSSRVPGINT